MKNELEKQLSGEWYNPTSAEIVCLQNKSRGLMREFNAEPDKNKRLKIMEKWFKKIGKNCYIEPNFFCDFGCNFILGKEVYLNTNCTILDSATVTIGDYTMIGSGVQILTPLHPLDGKIRQQRPEKEMAKPVTIGKNCWIASGAIILPGTTIRDNVTIGAGSVVTKDIPSNTIAYGNPCKVRKNV